MKTLGRNYTLVDAMEASLQEGVTSHPHAEALIPAARKVTRFTWRHLQFNHAVQAAGWSESSCQPEVLRLSWACCSAKQTQTTSAWHLVQHLCTCHCPLQGPSQARKATLQQAAFYLAAIIIAQAEPRHSGSRLMPTDMNCDLDAGRPGAAAPGRAGSADPRRVAPACVHTRACWRVQGCGVRLLPPGGSA